MTFKDIQFDNLDRNKSKSVQLTWQKDRSRGVKFSSATYSYKDPVFKCIESIIFTKEKSLLLKNPSRKHYLLPIKSNKLLHLGSRLSLSSVLPLWLLINESSAWNRRCRNDVRHSAPFLSLLKKSLLLFVKHDEANDEIRNKRKTNSTKTYTNPVQVRHVSIDAVAQSRAILEGSIGDDLTVTASLAGHSKKVHVSSYIDPKPHSKIPSSQALFGSQVGDELINLAKKYMGFKNKVEFLNETEIDEKLGITTESYNESDGVTRLNNIHMNAKKQGFNVGVLGEINDNYTTIILTTPITAALIISKIEHIKNSQERLRQDSKERLEISKIELTYLEYILSQFRNKTILNGKDLLKQYDFPMPDIL